MFHPGVQKSESSENYAGNIEFTQAKGPHSIMWENYFVTRKYRVKAFLLFIVFLAFYLSLCAFAMIYVKYYMASLRFNYVFVDQCAYLNDQFANNLTAYE